MTAASEAAGRRGHVLVTPEGVPLPIELATVGERAAAFLLDLLIWLGATLLVDILLILLLLKGIGGAAAVAVVLFTGTLFRTLYFIRFELGARAATPGKRLLGLRVVDRRGGPLLPGAVIARNLTREMEAFLPLGLLLSAAAKTTWDSLLLLAWLLAFAALPLVNRQRLRGGDLIAGTMVIVLPKRRLAADLADRAVAFAFTAPQLAAYGTYELQVLEQLLRAPDGADTVRARREVCQAICRKIDWPAPVAEADTDRFLHDFYAAQRATLERAQLFGKARADKHAAR